MTYELIASWITALATLALAIAAIVQLPLIGRQVKSLADQIELSRKAAQASERQTREWETLKACQSYDSDPVLDQATSRIWIASDHGKNYKNASVDRRDVICVLNYLDGLATGIEQNLYIEAVVRDHLGPVFDHAIVNFVDSGVVDRDGLKTVLALHTKWFRPHAPAGYQAPALSH